APQTSNPGTVAGWATDGQGEGIWAAAGMASDGNGVFAATGNHTGTAPATHQDSEEVVRITGMATKGATFFPSRWQAMDTKDSDLGSVNPMLIQQPGSTPANMLVQLSKAGHMSLVDAGHLGGMDGHTAHLVVSTAANSNYTAPTWYQTAKGTYVVFSS